MNLHASWWGLMGWWRRLSATSLRQESFWPGAAHHSSTVDHPETLRW